MYFVFKNISILIVKQYPFNIKIVICCEVPQTIKMWRYINKIYYCIIR